MRENRIQEGLTDGLVVNPVLTQLNRFVGHLTTDVAREIVELERLLRFHQRRRRLVAGDFSAVIFCAAGRDGPLESP
jgi:hypothetical protein